MLKKEKYWCWIADQYLSWRIAEYLWLWFTLLLSLLTYIPIVIYLWSDVRATPPTRRKLLVFLASVWSFTLSVMILIMGCADIQRFTVSSSFQRALLVG